MTHTLEPMTRGVDWSGADIAPSAIKKDGTYHFALRYSAGAGNHDPATQWKLCGLHEVTDLAKDGIDVVANSEWQTGRVTQGHAAGLEDGKADLAFWRARGYAQGAVIIVSWDEGQPDASMHNALEAYLRGYGEGLGAPSHDTAAGGHYKVGLYAGDVAIEAMLARGVIVAGWRAEASSWSANVSEYAPGSQWRSAAEKVAKVSKAKLWQTGNVAFGRGADEDVILHAGLPSHLTVVGNGPAPKPHPQPHPQPHPNPVKKITYTVKRGDTLSKIAKRYKVTVRQLVRWNKGQHHSLGDNPNLIDLGWKLSIFTAEKAGEHSHKKLGRRAPKGAPALELSQLVTSVEPTYPPLADNLGTDGWDMLGNDTYGDCVAVTWANFRRIMTRLAGDEKYPTLAEVETFYKTQNPGFPSQDEGMDIQTALEELVNVGGPDGVKAVAFAKVDYTNTALVKAAIAIFGGIWVGVNVDAIQMTQFDEGEPWNYVKGAAADGGHSILTGGYGKGAGTLGGDERFITWATETSFTDSFWAHQVEEAWVVVWPENLGTEQFEKGIDVAALVAAYHELTGKVLNVPTPPEPEPTPTPSPTPEPTPTPTPTAESIMVTDAADVELLLEFAHAHHGSAYEKVAQAILRGVSG